MATKAEFEVSDVFLTTQQRKDNKGEFQILHVKGAHLPGQSVLSEFTCIRNQLTQIPIIGSKVEVYYQSTENPWGKDNTILKINVLNGGLMNFLGEEPEVRQMKHQTSNTGTTETTVENQFFTINGKAFYSHIREPNTKGKYPSNKFEMILNVSDKIAEALSNLGVEVKPALKTSKTESTPGNFVKVRAKKQPKVTLGEDHTALTDIPLIGNGSDVILTVGTYPNRESNVKAGKGGKLSLGLARVQITNLISFSPTTKPLVDEDTGSN